jgi:hypothetical protein
VLPDTQYYASDFPDIFQTQTRWIAAEREAGNIAFVIHEGDVVDDDVFDQWTRASNSLHLLDGVVPYVISTGNHDYQGAGAVVSRGTMVDTYFPVSGFAQYPWFKGTFEPDHIENNYAVIDVPDQASWLVLSVEFGPRDEVLAWADQIVKQYPSLPAVVVTHAYLYEDDTRYDHLARPEQMWNPHGYGIGELPGQVNDGEEMWQKLVAGNSNIVLVLCGHVLDVGVGRLTSQRPDGSRVHQILANYQTLPLGGGGFLRVMRFFPAERKILVRTYSPYLAEFKTDPGNEFLLDY